MDRRMFLTAGGSALLVTGCQTTGPSSSSLAVATLPADLKVASTEGLATEYSRFVGIWDGKWGTALDGKLAVKSIASDGAADVYYAWGDHPEGRFKSGGFSTTGRIEGGVLTLEPFGNGANASYTLQDDGSLVGNYVIDGTTSIGRFYRRVES